MPYAQHLIEFLKTCCKNSATKSYQYAKSALLTRCNKLVEHYKRQWWVVSQGDLSKKELFKAPLAKVTFGARYV